MVAPFNSLVTKAGRGVPRVYVNLSKPGSTGVLGWLLRSALNTALQCTTHNNGLNSLDGNKSPQLISLSLLTMTLTALY